MYSYILYGTTNLLVGEGGGRCHVPFIFSSKPWNFKKTSEPRKIISEPHISVSKLQNLKMTPEPRENL